MIRTTELKTLKAIRGVSLQDRIPNEAIREDSEIHVLSDGLDQKVGNGKTMYICRKIGTGQTS